MGNPKVSADELTTQPGALDTEPLKTSLLGIKPEHRLLLISIISPKVADSFLKLPISQMSEYTPEVVDLITMFKQLLEIAFKESTLCVFPTCNSFTDIGAYRRVSMRLLPNILVAIT